MIRFSTSALDRYPLPLASAVAVCAAIFIITVWEPVQQRSLSDGIGSVSPPDVTWLDTSFTTSDGKATSLAAMNGHTRIVTMMYTHCPGVCPMTMATLGRIENQLSASERNRLRVVALTLDPEQDSPAALGQFRQAHGIDSPRWTLGRPSPGSVRRLAEGLGIQYSVMADGSVDHQSGFALLNASGQMIAKTANTQNPDPRFVSAVRHALQD